MAISEHDEEFAGLPVRDFVPGEPLDDPAGTAHRLALGYEDADRGMTFEGLWNEFLGDPASGRTVALVIGSWDPHDSSTSAGEVVAALADASDRLPGLKALFVGDITSDECEISWIQQADVTPLLAAFPALEHLRVRGAEGLAIGPVRHEGLRTLVIESGGLPAGVVRAVGAAEFPNLEHLELWLGSPGYGGDATPEDLAPILSGSAFPRLKTLGLRDCEWADGLAVALADAPVLRRIEALDLSLGNLGDEGAVALLSGGNLSGLKRLDIHHHYVSDEVLDGLRATGVDLNADDRQEPDEYGGETYRYIAVSE
jgi:hypothetical protein